ncbi:MAG: YojF family protein [Bacillaceae bacterium]|nr:YojF family protein [Bacillaceae bacterium]
MDPIVPDRIQKELDRFSKQDVYIHLETTNGAYASHHDEKAINVGAYIRNARIQYSRGKIRGDGPYRVGLKMESGWVYAEGLTHGEVDPKGRLLLAGHNREGKLTVALQLSFEPFE